MDSLIGKTVDNYRILEVIGRGGMGVVFKALDTNLEKIVALKMIDPFLARDENFVRRFKTEAKALAKLENSNIVGVYALRETESGFFMVMEYVESKPLSQSLQENGPFSLKDTVSITKQLLNAIGHAHKVGVIHRDIKPSNILLCYDGKIKVTDFGLAKVVQQKGPASTVTQARAGTLYYMSPEQVKGLKNVDTRSDLYSLGMSVYEMIAGRVPFDKTDSDFTIQKKIVDGEIPPAVKFNPDIPKKFTKIISKSIDKDPDKRYQSADEMLEDLLNFEKEMSELKGKPGQKIKTSGGTGKGFSIDFKKPSVLIPLAAGIIIVAALLFIFLPGGGATDEINLSINTSPPGAEIIINDNPAGNSPVENLKIAGGMANFKIRKQGYTMLDTVVNLVYGETDNLVFTLSPVKRERINITTNPSGARIIINSSMAGLSALENFSIEPGEHQVKIEKAGYLSYDTTIRVGANLSKSYSFVLSKDPDFKGFGTLKITSRPAGASVILNGRIEGQTPFESKEIPAGDYQLIIRQSGYADYNESVKIVKNKAKNISKELAVLSNKFGKIRISTKPSEASVFLDGEFLGSTPYENDKIPVGLHRLVIKKTGYSEFNQSVNIETDKLTPVSADLSAAAKIAVNSDPSGADVLINDKTVGKTPYTDSHLAYGEYTITIAKTGYKPYSEKLKITDNKTVIKIDQKLNPVTGKVEILVRPYGSIYINDELKAQDTNSPFTTELPGGRHKLKIVHPTLGSMTREILVTGEKTQKFNFDMSRTLKLTVVSNPANCEIFLNGESTGKYTPTQLRLKAGIYKIRVKRDGYNPSDEEKFEVSSSIYETSDEKEDRKEFTLTKSQ